MNSAAAGHYSGEYSEYSTTQLLNYMASLLRPLVPSVEFSAASRAHHDLKGAMEDCSLEHELLALANID